MPVNHQESQILAGSPGIPLAFRPDAERIQQQFSNSSATTQQQFSNNPATILQHPCNNPATIWQQLCNKTALQPEPMRNAYRTHVRQQPRVVFIPECQKIAKRQKNIFQSLRTDAEIYFDGDGKFVI
jgi:hypothetical protein